MNAETYKRILAQAKIDALEKWEGIKSVVLPNQLFITSCPLCDVAILSRKNYNVHYVCPLGRIDVYGDSRCCLEYYTWHHLRTPENAQAVINRINAVDVGAWTAELVKRGVLE